MKKLFLAVALAFGIAHAAEPTQIVNAYAPGAGTDIAARMVEKAFNTNDIESFVAFKPGAQTLIASNYVAHSKPDGKTVLIAAASITTFNLLFPMEGRRYEASSFDPVIQLAIQPMGIYVPYNSTINTFEDLIAELKAHPNQSSYAYGYFGAKVATEYLFSLAGVNDKILSVPYKGAAPAMVATASNEVTFSINSIPSGKALMDAKKVKLIAVTSAKRMQSYPQTPAVTETLPKFVYVTYLGVIVPAGTPKEVIAKYNSILNEELKKDDVKKIFETADLIPVGGSPEKFGKFLDTELKKWSVVKDKIDPADLAK